LCTQANVCIQIELLGIVLCLEINKYRFQENDSSSRALTVKSLNLQTLQL
jgi:hypothetical protein